jgi:membrane protease YdiL (CAAX protease family)
MVGIFVGMGGRWGTPASFVLAVGYMFCPTIAVLIVQKLIYKHSLRELGISFRLNRWWLVAWLLPIVAALVVVPVSLIMPGVEFTAEAEQSRALALAGNTGIQAMALPVHPFWIGLAGAVIAAVTVNAVAGFGEELGWRGLLQRELGRLGFWNASLVIGLIWGLWHMPLILQGHNYPQHPVAGVFMMVVFCVLLSPIFGYIRLKSGSVITAAIAHGSLNAAAGLPLIIIKGGNELTAGVTGLAGLLVLLGINGLILVHRRIDSRQQVPAAGDITQQGTHAQTQPEVVL